MIPRYGGDTDLLRESGADVYQVEFTAHDSVKHGMVDLKFENEPQRREGRF